MHAHTWVEVKEQLSGVGSPLRSLDLHCEGFHQLTGPQAFSLYWKYSKISPRSCEMHTSYHDLVTFHLTFSSLTIVEEMCTTESDTWALDLRMKVQHRCWGAVTGVAPAGGITDLEWGGGLWETADRKARLLVVNGNSKWSCREGWQLQQDTVLYSQGYRPCQQAYRTAPGSAYTPSGSSELCVALGTCCSLKTYKNIKQQTPATTVRTLTRYPSSTL